VAVTGSVVAGNGAGFVAASAAGQSITSLSLSHSSAVGNGTGIRAQGTNATLWLAQSTVVENGTGYSAVSGGTLDSFGDNYFAANGSNAGSLMPVGQQ
jgi:hypothetical protein